ncbi:MAG: hypothetical protein ACLR35_09485, partial [Streptococcus salivarius]
CYSTPKVYICQPKVLKKNKSFFEDLSGWAFSLPIFISLNCQIKLDFSCNSEKLGMVLDNSKTS